jgi:hypothetical protein
MRTQKNGLVRRTVTLTQDQVDTLKKLGEASGREFSAELRYMLNGGISSHQSKAAMVHPTEGGPRVSA